MQYQDFLIFMKSYIEFVIPKIMIRLIIETSLLMKKNKKHTD